MYGALQLFQGLGLLASRISRTCQGTNTPHYALCIYPCCWQLLGQAMPALKHHALAKSQGFVPDSSRSWYPVRACVSNLSPGILAECWISCCCYVCTSVLYSGTCGGDCLPQAALCSIQKRQLSLRRVSTITLQMAELSVQSGR